jgi:hypothetical protein
MFVLCLGGRISNLGDLIEDFRDFSHNFVLPYLPSIITFSLTSHLQLRNFCV